MSINPPRDNSNLVFPFHSAVKTKKLNPKRELERNKARLAEAKEQMKFMKDRIKIFTDILKKEIGEKTDIKGLLRHGGSTGWQIRAQTIMTLKMKLIAMRSKFLDPPHKIYYRGPFDPKKEFELKLLPQKQTNLYEKMLAEKKKTILLLDQPVPALQKELDELSLMYRAARFRTKNVMNRVKIATKELEKSKERAKFNLRAIEAMMAHQSLFKMMIEPKTFLLDSELKIHIKSDPLIPAEIEEWKKFKMLLDKTQQQIASLRATLLAFSIKIDEINEKIIESKRIDFATRLSFDAQNNPELPSKEKKGKDKVKQETDTENEYKLLTHENERIRQFLLSSTLMCQQDFKLFLIVINNAKQEFLDAIEDAKCANRDSE